MVDRRSLVVGLTLLGLATGSWWLREQHREPPERTPPPPHTPDYWVEQVDAVTMGPDGQPRRRLGADLMRHFPDDQSTELVNPRLLLFEPGRPPWQVQSEAGWVSPDGKLVLLQGEVRIDREAQGRLLPVHLETRDLRVQPKDEYAETDQEVRAEQGRHWITARGLQAWLRPPVRIKLLANARGHYEVEP